MVLCSLSGRGHVASRDRGEGGRRDCEVGRLCQRGWRSRQPRSLDRKNCAARCSRRPASAQAVYGQGAWAVLPRLPQHDDRERASLPCGQSDRVVKNAPVSSSDFQIHDMFVSESDLNGEFLPYPRGVAVNGNGRRTFGHLRWYCQPAVSSRGGPPRISSASAAVMPILIFSVLLTVIGDGLLATPTTRQAPAPPGR